MKRFVLIAFVLLFTVFANNALKAQGSGVCIDWVPTCAVTLYNNSTADVHYEMRVYRYDDAKKKYAWTEWETHRHTNHNGGWFYHYYMDVEKIQIRFDRIGGDGEITYKMYDLPFNRIPVNPEEVKECRHYGRPYKFEFDSGGKLLNLYNGRHSENHKLKHQRMIERVGD